MIPRLFLKEWRKARLEACVAHEYEEFKDGNDHDHAVEHAPETVPPIGDRARGLLGHDQSRRALPLSQSHGLPPSTTRSIAEKCS